MIALGFPVAYWSSSFGLFFRGARFASHPFRFGRYTDRTTIATNQSSRLIVRHMASAFPAHSVSASDTAPSDLNPYDLAVLFDDGAATAGARPFLGGGGHVSRSGIPGAARSLKTDLQVLGDRELVATGEAHQPGVVAALV